MDRDEFWTLIEAARAAGGGDCRQQTAHLVAALQQRTVDYFRGWLLAQGRAAWEAAVRDTDSLAAHPQIRAPDQPATPSCGRRFLGGTAAAMMTTVGHQPELGTYLPRTGPAREYTTIEYAAMPVGGPGLD